MTQSTTPGPAPEAAQTSNRLPGVNILLEGPAGTGKTHSIGTLVDAGIEVFYLGIESGLESLLGYWTDKGKPIPPNLQWQMVEAPKAGFAEMIDIASKINMLSFEALTKVADTNKSKYDQFRKILLALSNFTSDRDGKSYGAVDSWTNERAIVIDGLTGLNNASMANVVGGKPVRSMSDWGLAQVQVENLLRMLCDGCKCWFVLIAHVERETDQILGGIKLTTSTLGKALAPKIPAMFSDVILTARTGDKWVWDTANAQADLKTRNLPISSAIQPDFGQITRKWRARGSMGA